MTTGTPARAHPTCARRPPHTPQPPDNRQHPDPLQPPGTRRPPHAPQPPDNRQHPPNPQGRRCLPATHKRRTTAEIPPPLQPPQELGAVSPSGSRGRDPPPPPAPDDAPVSLR